MSIWRVQKYFETLTLAIGLTDTQRSVVSRGEEEQSETLIGRQPKCVRLSLTLLKAFMRNSSHQISSPLAKHTQLGEEHAIPGMKWRSCSEIDRNSISRGQMSIWIIYIYILRNLLWLFLRSDTVKGWRSVVSRGQEEQTTHRWNSDANAYNHHHYYQRCLSQILNNKYYPL